MCVSKYAAWLLLILVILGTGWLFAVTFAVSVAVIMFILFHKFFVKSTLAG